MYIYIYIYRERERDVYIYIYIYTYIIIYTIHIYMCGPALVTARVRRSARGCCGGTLRGWRNTVQIVPFEI